ncbi:uncharacterized protein G2W53_010123 [Senna tora]|uniref:Uncharacterized protein n=1 Tax=Senna tora TaxID=362788 RepID=A0A834WZM1_9FABA|nr:uncharacterized protein G2W53_010123 [Senna tora]
MPHLFPWKHQIQGIHEPKVAPLSLSMTNLGHPLLQENYVDSNILYEYIAAEFANQIESFLHQPQVFFFLFQRPTNSTKFKWQRILL